MKMNNEGKLKMTTKKNGANPPHQHKLSQKKLVHTPSLLQRLEFYLHVTENKMYF
jgi:hypothetical protein